MKDLLRHTHTIASFQWKKLFGLVFGVHQNIIYFVRRWNFPQCRSISTVRRRINRIRKMTTASKRKSRKFMEFRCKEKRRENWEKILWSPENLNHDEGWEWKTGRTSSENSFTGKFFEMKSSKDEISSWKLFFCFCFCLGVMSSSTLRKICWLSSANNSGISYETSSVDKSFTMGNDDA